MKATPRRFENLARPAKKIRETSLHLMPGDGFLPVRIDLSRLQAAIGWIEQDRIE